MTFAPGTISSMKSELLEGWEAVIVLGWMVLAMALLVRALFEGIEFSQLDSFAVLLSER